MPENDVFNFRFESDKPFTLYVWQRSPDGTSWDSPPTRRDAVAYTDPATGAAGFRYVPANALRGESVYRFAMVPAPAFQNLPVTMRAAWRCGNTYPPGCGPMSGAGFTTASPLMEKDAVIATHVSGGVDSVLRRCCGKLELVFMRSREQGRTRLRLPVHH